MYTLSSKPECAFHHFSCDCIKSFYISCHLLRTREKCPEISTTLLCYDAIANQTTKTHTPNTVISFPNWIFLSSIVILSLWKYVLRWHDLLFRVFLFCHLLEMFSIIWSKMSIFLFCFSLISRSKYVAKMLGGGSGIGAMVVWCESAYNIPNCE